MAKEIKTYSLRGASQFLATLGVDVSELRMRTLVNQHEIFVNDPLTRKDKTRDDSEVKQWFVSEPALREFAKVAAQGGVRTSTGAKAYKVIVTADQLASLRAWAQANGVADPERSNKAYTKKGKPAENGAVGSDIEQAFEEDADEGDGLFDEVDETAEA